MTINGRRLPIVLALEHLDEDVFTFLVKEMRLATTRAAFPDVDGLAQLKHACDVYVQRLSGPTPPAKDP